MREARRTAGWYDDETDAALIRYWDGAKWSPHTAPRPGRVDAREDSHDRLVALFGSAAPAVTVTLPLRPSEEHTTVPLPDESVAPEPRDRRRVGGRR